MLNATELTERLVLGSCPRERADAVYLQEVLQVSAVVCVQTRDDFRRWGVDWPDLTAAYRDLEIALSWVPISDGDPSRLAGRLSTALAELERLTTLGHRTYVHCTVGINRSPTVVLAYLVRHGQGDIERAAAWLQRRRFCAPNLDAVRALHLPPVAPARKAPEARIAVRCEKGRSDA